MDRTSQTERVSAEFRQAAEDAQHIALNRTYPGWIIQRGEMGWSATKGGGCPSSEITAVTLVEIRERIEAAEAASGSMHADHTAMPDPEDP